MHWIFVGIMIWIGLALAPAIIQIVLFLLPGVFFGLVIGLIGLSIAGTLGGFVGGMIIGAVAPYFIMSFQE